ncbi:MAG TPA: amidohydrolase family protein [Candidatus Eisenbacteria bacterium]|nr:amidohydrolase family protein [Candidatus Eisenbacteria bacterium]
MDCDLLIRGGSIVDGTGAPAYTGDVAVKDGRIVALGHVSARAERTIDAGGRVVAPGFIDIHTHYDAQILWDRMLSISPWHGVTTVVMGNCGFGVAPTRPAHRGLILRTLEKVEGMSLACLEAGCGSDWPFETFPEYLDAVERRGMAINVGALIGHTPVRLYVMGEEATERPATDDEIARMRAIVRDAVAAGAIGFASSKAPTHVGYAGKPVPSRVAEFEELRQVAGALGELGRGVLQMTAGPGLFFEQFTQLATETGRTLTWTALLAGMMGPGSHRMFLEQSEAIVKQGIPVVPQVACRPLNFEFDLAEPFIFESMGAFRTIAGEDREGRIRAYRDPAFRQRMRDELATRMAGVFAFSWERMVVSYYPPEPSLEERGMEVVARERGTDPVDLMLDLALASDLAARFRMSVVNFDEDEVAELLVHPNTMIGLSDAGAHASQLCDACFSTHLLGHWVREKGTLTLEQAVRMLTSRVADVMGIQDRGRLAPGLAADVTVFDPDTVGCSKLRRVHDLPAGADRLVADAFGINAVVVNGVVVREGGRDAVKADGALPGRLLRGGRA